MMRIFLFSLAGFPLLIWDGVLAYTFPGHASGIASAEEGWLLAGGAAAYLSMHFLVRKPERFYLWGHELAHLAIAKLFFRKIHQFNISSRSGGKVVMDGTNVVIDLAPYIFPLYSVAAVAAAVLLRSASPWVPDLYLVLASFLFMMHLVFSAEGFVTAQPDLTRSGRVFSAGVVLLCLLLWIPCLLAPGVTAGWAGAAHTYRSWLVDGAAASRQLVVHFLNFFPRLP